MITNNYPIFSGTLISGLVTVTDKELPNIPGFKICSAKRIATYYVTACCVIVYLFASKVMENLPVALVSYEETSKQIDLKKGMSSKFDCIFFVCFNVSQCML